MTHNPSAPRRFRGIRKQVNMFLLTAFLGFAGLVALVAYKQGMFESHTGIHFYAPDATGINKGMAVRLHGVLVGTVRGVELVERGVRVRLGINSDYIERLPRGSQARLTREGYVGAASIQILPGAPGSDHTPVAEGEEIRFIAQKGMAEMLDEVRQQMTPAFQELRRAAAEMANPDSDFRKSVTALRELIEELPPATREMRELVPDRPRAAPGCCATTSSLRRCARCRWTASNRSASDERNLHHSGDDARRMRASAQGKHRGAPGGGARGEPQRRGVRAPRRARERRAQLPRSAAALAGPRGCRRHRRECDQPLDRAPAPGALRDARASLGAVLEQHNLKFSNTRLAEVSLRHALLELDER